MNPLALTLDAAIAELTSFLPGDATAQASRLNTVCERLLARGKYRGFTGRAKFLVNEAGQITLPMDFETLIGATLDDQPQYLRDPWYEFAPKPDTGVHVGAAMRARDLGDGFVTFRSPATATALRLVSEDGEEVDYEIRGRRSEDEGAGAQPFVVSGTLGAVRIQVTGAGTTAVNAFYDTDGTYDGRPRWRKAGTTTPTNQDCIFWAAGPARWAITSGSTTVYIAEEDVATPDLVSAWSALFPGVSPVPAVELTSDTVEIAGEVGELTYFSKTRTTGRVHLEAQQADDSWLRVGTYEPRDTAVSYRRYALPTAEEGDVVIGFCKRRFRKAEDGSDPLAVESLYALRMALQAVSFEDAGETQAAVEYWSLAIKHLDDQLSEHRGSAMRTVPIFCKASAGKRLRAIR
jgi:hypothetical protein